MISLFAAAILAAAAPAAAVEPPAGGRPAGLGHAYTALALDGYAPLWNAAALPHLRYPQAAAMHAAAYSGASHEIMSVGFPLAARNGAGVVVDASRASAAFGAAFGRRLSGQMSLGAMARYLPGSGHALDLSSLYRYDESLSVGVVAANLGGRRGAGQDAKLAPEARLGAAYGPRPWFTYVLEGALARDGDAAIRTGAELRAFSFFALRVGVDSGIEGSSALGLTAGLGLAVAGQSLDVSVVPRGSQTTEQISLIVRFGREASRELPKPQARHAQRPAPQPMVFHLPPDWASPRAAEIPSKPSIQEVGQPGLIWLE